MALDDADAQEVALGIRDGDAVLDPDLLDTGRGDELVGDDHDDARATTPGPQAQVLRPCDPERVGKRHLRRDAVTQPVPVARHDAASSDHELNGQLAQIRRDEEVGAPSGATAPRSRSP